MREGLANDAVAAAELEIVRTGRVKNGQQQPDKNQARHEP